MERKGLFAEESNMAYNKVMFLFRLHAWYALAPVTLLFFVGVLFGHPYIPHAHGQNAFESTLQSVHTGVVERSFAFMLLIAVFTIFIPRIRGGDVVEILLSRGMQHADIPIFLPLRIAFARGRLHSRAH